MLWCVLHQEPFQLSRPGTGQQRLRDIKACREQIGRTDRPRTCPRHAAGHSLHINASHISEEFFGPQFEDVAKTGIALPIITLLKNLLISERFHIRRTAIEQLFDLVV